MIRYSIHGNCDCHCHDSATLLEVLAVLDNTVTTTSELRVLVMMPLDLNKLPVKSEQVGLNPPALASIRTLVLGVLFYFLILSNLTILTVHHYQSPPIFSGSPTNLLWTFFSLPGLLTLLLLILTSPKELMTKVRSLIYVTS